MNSVALTKLIEKMNLENCTPDVDINQVQITQTDVNRPADYCDKNQ